MRRLKLFLKLLPIIVVGGLLHYVLPQHDIVKITSTEVIRQDFTAFNRIFYAQADSGSAENPTRDLRLVNTQRQKTWVFGFFQRDAEEIMVYRNEDTGWIWPPYFKFDSSDAQAEASANISPPGQEKWVILTHYGWRNRLMTIYPNVIGIKQVDGPDVRVIPWFNIFFFAFLLVAWLFVRAAWRQFRERSIDPVLEDAGEAWDAVDAKADAAKEHATGVWGRVKGWLGTWRGKPRK